MPLTAILLTDVGGLSLGAWLLWGGGRARSSSWTADVLYLGVLGLGLAGSAFLFPSPPGEGFLVVRLWCHALFCVLAPLAIARGLQLGLGGRGRRARARAGLVLALLGGLAEGGYLWALHVEPRRLEVTVHTLTSPRLAPGTRLRVAVLADLQTEEPGAWEQHVFTELDALRADLVLVPGDLSQVPRGGGEGERERRARVRARLVALFAGLGHPPRLGFLMVQGNCERDGERFDDLGLRSLDGEIAVFPEEGLQVIGLDLRASRLPLAPERLEAARAFPGLTIVLGHAPDFVLSAGESGLPLLCLAGHTHGGQVQLPFYGPPITLSRVPRAIAAGGLHRLGEAWVCVSRGIGMEGGLAPRIRFRCRPQLVAFDLEAQD